MTIPPETKGRAVEAMVKLNNSIVFEELFAESEGDAQEIDRQVATRLLDAALAVIEADAWMSIDSAPKDGRRVLCWNPHWEVPETGSAFYLPRLNGTGWAANFLAAEKGGWKHQPTRWRWLPPPPKGAL